MGRTQERGDTARAWLRLRWSHPGIRVVLEVEDKRRDYGEQRFIVVGDMRGITVTVVWTPRGDRRRIISAWQSSNRERRQYREYRASVE